MRLLIQRVSRASVTVEGRIAGQIERGLLVFIAIAATDTRAKAEYLARRLVELRIFQDTSGKMNLSVSGIGGSLLVVSQFTLYGDLSRGRRPSFEQAAPPTQARELYDYFVKLVEDSGLITRTGTFQAHMYVELVNDGPVTFLMEA